MFTNGNISSRISISEMSRGCSFTEEVKLKSLTASTFYDRLLYIRAAVVLCYVHTAVPLATACCVCVLVFVCPAMGWASERNIYIKMRRRSLTS